MSITKLKFATGMFLILGVVGIGAAQVGQRQGTAQVSVDQKKPAAPKPAVKEVPQDLAVQVNPAKAVREIDLMHEKLSKPVTLDKALDGNTPLKDAIEYLGDRFDVSILIDQAAFTVDRKDVGKDDPKKLPVEETQVRLPRMVNISVRLVLGMLCDQVDGVLLVTPDALFITTKKRAWPSLWDRNSRDLVPTVNVSFKNVSLEEALKELSSQSGINVILNAPTLAGDEEQKRIRQDFRGVQVDTAVRLLANMHNLRTIAVDNVLYVTEPGGLQILQEELSERAEREKEQDSAKKKELPAVAKPDPKKSSEKK